MKDGSIIIGFKRMEAEINKIKRQLGGTDQEIVTLRLQMNAFVRMVKWMFPFNLLFKYFVEKEWKTYTDALEKRRKQIMKMREQMEKTKKIAAISVRQGRNDQCKCGSGKKHKKCCLDKKDDIKIPSKPADIEKALKDSNNIKEDKETKEEYIKREGKPGNE